MSLTIMDSNSDELLALIRLGLRHHLGMWYNKEHRNIKRAWRQSQGWPIHCYKCGIKTTKGREDVAGSMTLEHIIPEWLIFELELPEILFDFDNFMLLCGTCNRQKGGDMPPAANLSPELLGKFYWALDERNKRIALAR